MGQKFVLCGSKRFALRLPYCERSEKLPLMSYLDGPGEAIK
jgi:hypothetical protein